MTTDEVWPPPPTTGWPWHVRRLPVSGEDQDAEIKVREVLLWGRMVLIDEDHTVWCSHCWEFINAKVLGRSDNLHRGGRLPDREGRTFQYEDQPARGDTGLGEF